MHNVVSFGSIDTKSFLIGLGAFLICLTVYHIWNAGKFKYFSAEESSVDSAKEVLEIYGLNAHQYHPNFEMDNQELANACRLLAEKGYLITHASGALLGSIEPANNDCNKVRSVGRTTHRIVAVD